MRILITSGPTREYLDPVRFLSNSSSGKMGRSLAAAALARGHEVVLLSGPVSIAYPEGVELHRVNTTEEMFTEALAIFPSCDLVIGAAAPCDYRPKRVSETKLSKSDFSGTLQLEETPDILAALGKMKRENQKIVAFALETHEGHERARKKLQRKNADFIVLNTPQALDADTSRLEILARTGDSLGVFEGSKAELAEIILDKVAFQS